MNGFRFGVEIEFTGATCDAVTRYLSDNGVNIYYAGYSHSVSDQWKVVTDASVTVGGIGGELASPILSGVTGLFDLDRVVQILNEVPNIGVDRRCGLHVHVSWDGMTVAQVQTIVNRFTKYEDWFDSIQPVSRRANRFCKAVKETTMQTSDLAQFYGSETLYRHFTGMKFSEGVKYFAEKAEAFWLLDLTASLLPKFRKESFVVVQLTVNGSAADFKLSDGNGSYLAFKRIAYTDCPEGAWKFYVVDNIMILPSE